MSELTPAAEAVILKDGRSYDAACKRILSQKQILARIMKECVREYRKCTPEEIERLIEGEPEVENVCVMPDMTNSQVSIRIYPNAPEYKQNTIAQYVIRERHPVGHYEEESAFCDLMNVTMI